MSEDPISPEGERAAQKVRTAFFALAAANIVIVAIVMMSRSQPDPVPAKPAALGRSESQVDPAIQEMIAIHERLLHGYQTRDAERFCEVFSKQAQPPADEEFFRVRIIADIQDQYGEIVSKTLSAETKPAPDGGLLVYDAVTRKLPNAQIRCRFVRESDGIKVIEWRLGPR